MMSFDCRLNEFFQHVFSQLTKHSGSMSCITMSFLPWHSDISAHCRLRFPQLTDIVAFGMPEF